MTLTTTTTTTSTTLRSRIRVTNKTRLRVFRNRQDVDIGHGEDREAAECVSTAGVDAEDAKEHHLQAILSAADTRIAGFHDTQQEREQRALLIPIPDHAGLFFSYDEIYPPGQFSDPATYYKCSTTVEENINAGLTDGFTYYMDDQDKEWLDSCNAASTSAVSLSAESRGRNTKGRGRVSKAANVLPVSYDEFELVMGLFEMITEQQALSLCENNCGGTLHSMLPVYLSVLDGDLTSFFSNWTIPTWAPGPSRLLALANFVFTYWQERRKARNGHRIIPTLNYDQSDSANESYVCFRRREIKAVRKTRTAIVSSAEKLRTLKIELKTCQELAGSLCQREELKRQLVQAQVQVWMKRKSASDLLQAFPRLATAGDEALFADVQPATRKRKIYSPQNTKNAKVKLSHNPRSASLSSTIAPPVKQTMVMAPKDRFELVRTLEDELLRGQLASNDGWVDLTEDACEVPAFSLADSYFRTPSFDSSLDDQECFEYRTLRLRRGRGGIRHLDRRLTRRQSSRAGRLEEISDLCARSSGDKGRLESAAAIDERGRRLREQWMFDDDSGSFAGLYQLTDDFRASYLGSLAGLITDSDICAMESKFTLSWTDDKNRIQQERLHIIGPQAYTSFHKQANDLMRKAKSGWDTQEAELRVAPAEASPSFITQRDTAISSPTATSILPSYPSAGLLPLSLSNPVDLTASPSSHEGLWRRSARPIRGAINMPCVPPFSAHDNGALKRVGFNHNKPLPSCPPSITKNSFPLGA